LQATVIGNKRDCRKLKKKIDKIEEVNEELDLSEINAKASLSVGDILKAMRSMQQSVMAKMITTAQHDALQGQLVDN